MANSSILVCGQRFDIGQRVITFADDPSISAYTPHRIDQPRLVAPFAPAHGLAGCRDRWRPRRLIGADRSLSRLRQVLRQFVIHHDGCDSSRQCFHVLHDQRGLSVHFLIDNDGTVFQTLDVLDCAFQAAGVNEISVGVELCNRGDALRYPNDYHGRRDKVTCRINGHQWLAYAYTPAQLASMVSLGRAMARLFPNLPPEFPVGGDGDQLWATLTDVRQYTGYLGHYHVSANKWDPGPFDFKSFASQIRSRTFFPLVVAGGKPDLPDAAAKAEELASALYDNNERDGQGGYFPVGPFGASRLWHGGVHLRADAGTPVYAPFGGKLVAARMTDDCSVGSRNFVLIRSDLPWGAATLRFFTLLFHLAQEAGGAVPWLARAQLGDEAMALDIEIAAGELVGHVGEAGPPGRFEGQLHLEVFSADEIGAVVEPDYWTLVDGANTGRICSAPEVVRPIDGSGGGARDGLLSRAELINFFRDAPERRAFRRFAVRHLSEWADNHDWPVVLNKLRDFAALPPVTRQRLYRDQIAPVAWWTDELGDAAGLPPDKVVWSYHPVTFLVWLHQHLRTQRIVSKGIEAASAFGGQAAPSDIHDDSEATDGFTDDEDIYSGAAGKRLELEDLANGYPDDPSSR